MIRVLGRGDAVGELALLTDSPRSASVRARRDSELLKCRATAFEKLLDRAARVRAQPRPACSASSSATCATRASTPNPIPGTIAMIPLQPDLPLRDIGCYGADAARQLALGHDARRLARAATATTGAALLDEAERDHEQVLLMAHNPDPTDPWTAFCERQADRTVVSPATATCRRGSTSAPTSTAASSCCSSRAQHRLDPLARRARARATRTSCPTARARHRSSRRSRGGMAGRSIGLVLSGGGARAFAHIGVLEELLARDYVIDRVAGCSGGAFIGGLFAMGKTPEEILAITPRASSSTTTRRTTTRCRSSPSRAGRRAAAMVERVFGETTIEELPRDYFCVSTDMLTSELVVHRRGLLAEAAAASMTLPGVFPPRPIGGTAAARRRAAEQPAGRRDGRRRRGAGDRLGRVGALRAAAALVPRGRPRVADAARARPRLDRRPQRADAVVPRDDRPLDRARLAGHVGERAALRGPA